MAVSNKIVFVTAIPSNEEPRAFIASANCRRSCDANLGRSAIVIRKMNSKLLIHSKWCSIQKNGEAWSVFQDAVKDMLAIPKHNSIILYGSDPPYHPVKDIFWVLNQPTISMNIYVSSINDTSCYQLKSFSLFPARLTTAGNQSGCSRVTSGDDKTVMNLNVAGLEAALARTRQYCNELSCDIQNTVQQFNSDMEIDQLLSLANAIVTDLQAGSGSKKSSCITSSGHTSLDVPNGVALLPRSPCGVHVLWNPVRLDEEDHNHGQAVIGYNVYVNGKVKVQTDGALNCQTILSDLEEEQQYCIQVCTRSSSHESQPSNEIMYRHRSHVAVDSTADRRCSRISSSQCSEHCQLSSSHHNTDITLFAVDHHSGSTSSARTDKDDACSQSSRTSGIEADYLCPNSISAKTASSCYKENSPFSSSGNSSSSSFSDENSFDCFLEGTPQLARHYRENKKKIQRSGPDPPLNIRVHPSSDGTRLVVSWTPVRRDSQGCNNGCHVLGYRVYANNRAIASVDGPSCFKTEIPLFADDDVDIYLCTRSIAGESIHSKVIKKAMSSISNNSVEQQSTTVTHSSRRHGKPCHSLASSRELLRVSPAPQRIETYV